MSDRDTLREVHMEFQEYLPADEYDFSGRCVEFSCPCCNTLLSQMTYPLYRRLETKEESFVREVRALRQFKYCWNCGQKIEWPNVEE